VGGCPGGGGNRLFKKRKPATNRRSLSYSGKGRGLSAVYLSLQKGGGGGDPAEGGEKKRKSRSFYLLWKKKSFLKKGGFLKYRGRNLCLTAHLEGKLLKPKRKTGRKKKKR